MFATQLNINSNLVIDSLKSVRPGYNNLGPLEKLLNYAEFINSATQHELTSEDYKNIVLNLNKITIIGADLPPCCHKTLCLDELKDIFNPVRDTSLIKGLIKDDNSIQRCLLFQELTNQDLGNLFSKIVSDLWIEERAISQLRDIPKEEAETRYKELKELMNRQLDRDWTIIPNDTTFPAPSTVTSADPSIVTRSKDFVLSYIPYFFG